RDLIEAHRPHLAVAQLHHVLPIEQDAASFDLARGFDHPHQRQRHGRFARTRLTDQTKARVRFEGKAHTIDGFYWTAPRVIVDTQIFDCQDWLAHAALRSLGFATWSSPIASRNRPIKVMIIIAIGGAHHHHNPRKTDV